MPRGHTQVDIHLLKNVGLGPGLLLNRLVASFLKGKQVGADFRYMSAGGQLLSRALAGPSCLISTQLVGRQCLCAEENTKACGLEGAQRVHTPHATGSSWSENRLFCTRLPLCAPAFKHASFPACPFSCCKKQGVLINWNQNSPVVNKVIK